MCSNGGKSAILCDDSGPTFGESQSDIYISDCNPNTSEVNHCNFGNSYKHRDYPNGSEKAKTFLAGTYEFQVAEIEVYTKKI